MSIDPRCGVVPHVNHDPEAPATEEQRTMKHEPKTPLPWKYVPAVRNNAPNYYAVGTGKWREPVAALCDEGNDAAYITHAANAYPKLIEHLLRDSLNNPTSPTGERARALLRELGEI
jgi:hypothetical protein